MNTIDIVILAVLVLAVVFALRRMRAVRKKGCSCGSGDCAGNCAACRSACSHKKKS